MSVRIVICGAGILNSLGSMGGIANDLNESMLVVIDDLEVVERQAKEIIELTKVATAAELVDSFEPNTPRQVVGQDADENRLKGKWPKVFEGAREPIRGPTLLFS